MITTLIRNGAVVTVDANDRILEGGSVLVRDGTIAWIGLPGDEPDDPASIDEVIDARGKVVAPGFINSHTHGCMLYQRTIGYDRHFDDWFANTQLPMMRRMTLQDYGRAELLTMAENLLEGNTTVVENCFFPNSVRDMGSPEEGVVLAARAVGARLVLATSYVSAHTDEAFVEPDSVVLARMESALHDWHRRDLVVVAPSLLLPWATTPDLLSNTLELARSAKAMMHFHTAETAYYNDLVRELHGARSNVGFLRDVGALGPDIQLVGCSEINDEDVDLVVASGTRVISVPTSDMFQSHKPLRMRELLNRGVPVSFGANGCAGNGRQGMFEAMKDGAGLVKALEQDPVVLNKDRALRMATIDAARNLGIDDLVGSIEVGKRADLILVDLTGPHVTPALNVVAALVYSCRGPDVTDVMVDGDWVVRRREVVGCDLEDLTSEVLERARAITGEAAVLRALAGDR